MFLCLLIVAVLSLNIGCKDFHFGGAVDYFPGLLTIATIDNLTPDNVIVFLDGEPFGIAISSGEPFDVSVDGFGPHVLEDHTLEVQDSRFQTLYTHYQHKEAASIAVTIVPYETAPAPGYTNYYYDGLKFHNPNGERSVIFVNGNPFGVVFGHSGTFVKFINPALDYASYSYLVEARNTHDELLYWRTFDYAQIVNREALLLPIEPYSLSMNNLTEQQLKLSTNGEFVGDINPQSDVFFTDLKITPSINWNFIEDENYLFEAKDSTGNVLYSENLKWTVINSRKGVISIPF